MTENNKLIILAQWLIGEFENANQAREQPNWFVHIRLWHRLLPIRIDGNIAIFAEQAPILKLDQPYRQRILVIKNGDNSYHLIGQYYGFKEPNKFRGAGMNPQLLTQLSPEDLVNLPGCTLRITEQENKFIAQPEPGAKCLFEYDGQIRQVVLGLEVREDGFKSFDRGVDPETGQGLWGALIGPYEYQKIQGFPWPD